MGLRCSLLGHNYGESEIEREREERGDEAVLTVREVRTCSRCDDRTVVSENKEVTAVATGDDRSASSPEPTAQPTDREASIPDDPDPEEDDGVILEEDAEDDPVDRDREYGEWPDADEPLSGTDDGEADPTPWPDADASEPAPTAEDNGETRRDSAPESGTPGADGVDANSGAGAGTGDEASSGGAPDETEFDADRPSEGDRAVDGSVGGQLACPECGHVIPAADSSFREGDVCPKCHSGYLTVR